MPGKMEDPLFLAVTRPALTAGVPVVAAGGILMACSEVIIATKNPLYALLAGGIAWGGARLLTAYDPCWGSVVMAWSRTKAIQRAGRKRWGGAVSVTPLPVARGRARG